MATPHRFAIDNVVNYMVHNGAFGMEPEPRRCSYPLWKGAGCFGGLKTATR